MQSLWANLFEGLSDALGRGIRYGEPDPVPGLSVVEIQGLVEGMQSYSANLEMHENEWQEFAEYEDVGQRATALGAAGMTKTMLLAAPVVAMEKALKAISDAREGE